MKMRKGKMFCLSTPQKHTINNTIVVVFDRVFVRLIEFTIDSGKILGVLEIL